MESKTREDDNPVGVSQIRDTNFPLKVTLTESIGNSGNREYPFDTYHETSYCLTSSLTSTLMDTDPEDLGRISPIRA